MLEALKDKNETIWERFENIRFYETFYTREGQKLLKTGGNTAVSTTGIKEVFVFEHNEPVRRTAAEPNYRFVKR